MFLDNRQVAMDSVLEALADSIDYFQDNIERLRPSLRDTLKPYYEQRLQQMGQLQQLARTHLKMLPRDADVERDDFLWLWSRLKSFVGNDSQVLINELLEQERLPTGGASKFESVLTVDDFVKKISVAESGRSDYMDDRELGTKLASIENMESHKKA
ncbi:MAG: histidinol dehydrogenase, partial [Halomonas sp.]